MKPSQKKKEYKEAEYIVAITAIVFITILVMLFSKVNLHSNINKDTKNFAGEATKPVVNYGYIESPMKLLSGYTAKYEGENSYEFFVVPEENLARIKIKGFPDRESVLTESSDSYLFYYNFHNEKHEGILYPEKMILAVNPLESGLMTLRASEIKLLEGKFVLKGKEYQAEFNMNKRILTLSLNGNNIEIKMELTPNNEYTGSAELNNEKVSFTITNDVIKGLILILEY